MPPSAKHSVSVAAVIVDDSGRVLLTQRRDNGKWEPPGGVLELEESILDGLRREVREETGLEIEPERLTGVYKNMPRGIVALVFRARVIGGEVRTSSETSRFEWCTAEQAKPRMDEVYVIRVLDALDINIPAIRTHDGTKLIGDVPTLVIGQ